MAKVETIVFLSLVLDLFAFTIPLPLFPRLIEWYTLVSMTWHAISDPLLISLSVARELRSEWFSLYDTPFGVIRQRSVL
jgi:hypothetical protein